MKSFRETEIGVIVYSAVQLAAVYGLTDLFEAANRLMLQHCAEPASLFRVSHWRLSEPGGIPSKGGAERAQKGEVAPAVLVLPPSTWEPPRAVDARPYADWLVSEHRRGATLASICGGAFVLAETGLLAGRTATTHWAHAHKFGLRFPDVRLDIDRLIIDDGDILSAGGMMAWIDVGLRLVDRFMGPVIMAETARFLLVDLPGGKEQRFYSAFSPVFTHGDTAVLKVQHWLQSTGAKEADLTSLASCAGLEERTLLRRFRRATGLTPIDYCQRLRVGKARELLQFSTSPVASIAWDVGYGDPGSFRKVFFRITGLTPGEFRRRFGVVPDTGARDRANRRIRQRYIGGKRKSGASDAQACGVLKT